jgi:hypothetical protein
MKKLPLVLSAATLVVGIVAAVLWKQLHAERENLAELRAQVTAMEGAPATFPAAAAQSTPAAVITAQGASVVASSSSSTATTAAAVDQDLRGDVGKGVADVMASQEGREMTRNLVRSALAQQLSDLAAELKLTPSETEKFIDLLAKQASDTTSDVFGMLGGAGAASADSQRKMVERQLENDREIARMLGDKYAAWQEYQGTITARQQVAQLRSLLGSGQDALSDAQSKPLITVLGAEQTRINKEEQNRLGAASRSAQNINVLEDQLKGMSAHNERLVNAASSHLTTSQLDRYKRMLGQQETMLRTIMGSMNGQGNAAGQGGTPR